MVRSIPSWVRSVPFRWLAVILSYAAVGTALLWPSIRPGVTLLPTDILAAVDPFRAMAGGSSAYNPLVSDAPFQFYPWLEFFADGIREGRIWHWNPFVLAGVPVTPNGYVSAYYPGFWAVGWMDVFDFYNLFVLAHLTIGALGLFAFMRVLRVRWMTAWVAGLAGFVAMFWVHWSLHLIHLVGMVWLPWVLAAMHALIRRPTRSRVVAMGFVTGLWWLGANLQYAYLGMLTAVTYGLLLLIERWIKERKSVFRSSAAVVVGLVLAAGMAAPVLLPTAFVSSEILRSGEPVEAMTSTTLSPSHIIRMLVDDAQGDPTRGFELPYHPEFYMDTPFVGVSTLLLATASIGAWRRSPRAFLLVVIGAAVVLAFLAWPHRFLHPWLPGYDRFRVSARWLAVLPAFVVPLAGLGLDDLRRGHVKPRRALAVGAAAAAGGLIVWYGDRVSGLGATDPFYARAFVLGAAFLVLVTAAGFLAMRTPRSSLAVILLIIVLEAGFNTTSWYPQIRKDGAIPATQVAQVAFDRGGRIVRVADEYTLLPAFAPNLPMIYGIRDAQGQAVLFPRAYDRYLRIIEDYGDFALATNTAPPLTDPGLLGSPLLDALDVRTVVVPSNITVPSAYELLTEGEPRLYGRNSPGAAVVVPRADGVSEEEMWQRLEEPSWDPTESASVIGLDGAVRGGRGTARPHLILPDSESWTVDAPDGGLLRVSGAYDPGWTAMIDGQETPVLRMDGIFRGVVLPPGNHLVEFSYRNAPEDLGRWVAIITLALLLGLLVRDATSGPIRSSPPGDEETVDPNESYAGI